jgi:putative transposase
LRRRNRNVAEVWVRRIKAECLDHFIVLGENYLRHLIREWLEHYHTERPRLQLMCC